MLLHRHHLGGTVPPLPGKKPIAGHSPPVEITRAGAGKPAPLHTVMAAAESGNANKMAAAISASIVRRKVLHGKKYMKRAILFLRNLVARTGKRT